MKPDQVKSSLVLTSLGIALSVLWVGDVLGGGPEGGEITPGPKPPLLQGPQDRNINDDSAGLVRVLSGKAFDLAEGSLTDSALVVNRHSSSDVALLGAPTSDDSLEVRVKDDHLALWSGLNQLRLHGRFSATDWVETDGEQITLVADLTGRGLLLVWVGQRTRTDGDILGSFASIQGVHTFVLPSASLDLATLKDALLPLGGQGLDVGVALISGRKSSSGRQHAYAAFAVDDQITHVDVETP